MLSWKMTSIEIVDAAIHMESIVLRRCDAILKMTQAPTLIGRLSEMKKDISTRRKTLRSHRREIFGAVGVSLEESEVASDLRLAGLAEIECRADLVRALDDLALLIGRVSVFYKKQRHSLSREEVRIFMGVLSDDGEFQVAVIRDEIERVEGALFMPW